MSVALRTANSANASGRSGPGLTTTDEQTTDAGMACGPAVRVCSGTVLPTLCCIPGCGSGEVSAQAAPPPAGPLQFDEFFADGGCDRC
jgi:hypothetical protein